MATVAALNAVMRADTSGFISGIGGATAALTKLKAEGSSTSEKMNDLGKNLSLKVTAPLVGIGTASIAAAMEFGGSMKRMEALVGIPADQVEVFRSQIMELGPATGRMASELGDAMFYVTSAGLRGEKATQALEYAAKGAAIGLGETATVADAVTSAMNAYTNMNLGAAEATDVLIATVREGKMAPEQLAGSLGKVLPMAAALHIKFGDVGGAMALMTRTGLNSAEAATALRGIMSALLDPSDAAREAMTGVGLSADILKKTIDEKGLLAVLQLLQERMGGNDEAISAMFGNVRGLTGFLNIMGQDGAEVARVFDSVANSAGTTDKAFAIVSQGNGFKVKQAMSEIKNSLIDLGGVLLPFVGKIASAIATAAGWFNALPGPVMTAVVAFGALAAAIGPALLIGAKVVQWGNLIATTFPRVGAAASNVGGKISNLVGGMGGLAGAVGAGLAVWGAWTTMMNKAANEGREFASKVLGPMQEKMAGGNMGIDEATSKIGALNGQIKALGDEMNDSSAPWDADYRESLKAGNAELEKQRNILESYRGTAEGVAQATGANADEVFRWLSQQQNAETLLKDGGEAVKAWNTHVLEASGVNSDNAAAVAEMGQGYVDARVEMEQARDALKEWTDAVNAQFDPLFGMLDATQGLVDKQVALKQAQADAATAAREHGYASTEYADAQRNVAQAQNDLLKSNVDLDIAARQLALTVQQQPQALADAKAAIDAWVVSGRISADTAAALKRRLDESAYSALVLNNISPLVHVKSDTTDFDNKYAQVWNKITSLWGAGVSVNPTMGPAWDGGFAAHPTGRGARPMAAGGVVSSPTFIMAGEAGREAVVPLDNPSRRNAVMAEAGLGGSTYNVTINGFVGDRRDLVNELVESIRRIERERGT